MPRTCPKCQTEWGDDIDHCPEDGTDLVAAEEEANDPLLGRVIGSYTVQKLLGRGGMGAVYLAAHPVIGSRVAVKFLHPQYSDKKKVVDRFFNEARAVNVIGHDNILKILDLNVTEDGLHYFVMEYLVGKPLQDLVENETPVPLEVAGPILLQFCEALQAAHDRRIYHRDIKPENIYLVTHKGRKNFVKVVDFGVAKLTDQGGAGGKPSMGVTQTGMVVGTPAYMSPEQAGGLNSKIDARSDVYSTGVLMFQLATGKLPFPSPNFGEVLIGHMQMAPPQPRSINPDIAEEWERIILKALAKKPEDRYQSMHEMSGEIAHLMGALGISPELPMADAGELAALGQHAPLRFPGPRTELKVGQQPKRKEAPRFAEAQVQPRPDKPRVRSGQTLATRMQAPQTAYTEAPTHQHKQQRQLLQIILAGVVLLIVVIGLVLWAGAPSEQQLALKRAKQATLKASRAADEAVENARKEAEKTGPVLLSVVSDPLGADVEAVWKDGGFKKGVTPMDFRVARNTKVTFNFKLPGHLPYRADVIADESQVVRADLQSDGRAVRRGGSGGTPRKESTPGDLMEVNPDDLFK
jgi:serine/threonine protein kinase